MTLLCKVYEIVIFCSRDTLRQPRTMLRTKSQQKTLCDACPVAKVADLVGDSCTLLIIRDLLSGPQRFGDLSASLHGISTRTLANKLRVLETSGIVERQEFKEKPPRVTYTLTKKGMGLHGVLDAMLEYGEKYF